MSLATEGFSAMIRRLLMNGRWVLPSGPHGGGGNKRRGGAEQENAAAATQRLEKTNQFRRWYVPAGRSATLPASSSSTRAAVAASAESPVRTVRTSTPAVSWPSAASTVSPGPVPTS